MIQLSRTQRALARLVFYNRTNLAKLKQYKAVIDPPCLNRVVLSLIRTGEVNLADIRTILHFASSNQIRLDTGTLINEMIRCSSPNTDGNHDPSGTLQADEIVHLLLKYRSPACQIDATLLYKVCTEFHQNIPLIETVVNTLHSLGHAAPPIFVKWILFHYTCKDKPDTQKSWSWFRIFLACYHSDSANELRNLGNTRETVTEKLSLSSKSPLSRTFQTIGGRETNTSRLMQSGKSSLDLPTPTAQSELLIGSKTFTRFLSLLTRTSAHSHLKSLLSWLVTGYETYTFSYIDTKFFTAVMKAYVSLEDFKGVKKWML